MKPNHNNFCKGCQYDGGSLCLSKTIKKELKYQKYVDGSDIIFQLTYCGERKIVETATS
ncbi:MAG: hypothetical protein SCK28_00130 [Bacillota bacterium]|nr:hypothetical protein [Bacillota bacterium]